MSRALIYRGRGKADLYHVAYNADANGNATRVLLSPRDKWVGNDYWTYDGEITMSTLDRAVRVMARYENRGQMQNHNYLRAKRIAFSQLTSQTRGDS